MKKNLRIVSVAAAALLAVAPVAASVTTVNAAAPVTTATATNGNSHINLTGATVNKNNDNVVDVTPSLTLTGKNGNVKGNLTGSISATLGGKSYTGNLDKANGIGDVTITDSKGKAVNAADVEAGVKYDIAISNLGFNFGSVNHGKTITFASSNDNVTFAAAAKNPDIKVSKDGKTVTVTLDQNGTVSGLTVKTSATAYDSTNTNGVEFYNIASGSQVKEGTALVLANAQGKLNIASILPVVNSNFKAVQLINGKNENGNGSWSDSATIKTLDIAEASAIKDQLKAQNITVDPNGFFTAPHSFKVTVKATSEVNGKSAELPVTFTVANVAEPVAPSVSKTIMHNAYYYNKEGQRVGTEKATRYDSVTVAPKTTTINGKTYYQVVENGKAVDKYINAGNIDGTKRTLKHNAYVYKTSKKRANKVVLKKGDTVTTYGTSYKFKNGKRYYKIGNNTDKTYVKVANFQ